MRADRPPTRHKDKTKTPVFVCCCAWKWRLQKPTYCEYARLRVAHVSPWKPLGVRTIASPLREYARLRVSNPIRLLEMGAVWYARLRAYMYGSHDCEHTCLELALRDLGEMAGVRTIASPWKNTLKFLGIYPNRAHRCAKAPRKPCAPMSTKTKATTSDPRRSRIIYDRTLGSWSERSPGTGALLAT